MRLRFLIIFLHLAALPFAHAEDTPKLTDVPESFRKDGMGPVDKIPFQTMEHRPLSARQLEIFRTHFQLLQHNPEDVKSLGMVSAVLGDNGFHTESVPFVERYLARGGYLNSVGITNYIDGLARLARFDDAEKIVTDVERRQPDCVASKDSRESIHFNRCIYACIVEKDLVAAATALKKLHDNFIIFDYPAPLDSAFDCFVSRLADDAVHAKLNQPGSQLQKIDFVWPYLPPTHAQLCVDKLKAAGIDCPPALLVAADLFNNSQPAPPGAWMVRSRYAFKVLQSFRDAARLIELGVTSARKQDDPHALLYALSFQINLCFEREDFSTALKAVDEALVVATTIGTPGAVSFVTERAGAITKLVGDIPKALEQFQKAYKLACQVQDTEVEERTFHEMVEWAIASGNGAVVAPLIERCLRSDTASQGYLVYWRLPLAQCYMQTGKPARAAEIFRATIPLLIHPGGIAEMNDYFGSSLLSLGDLDGADAAFDTSGAASAKLDNPLREWSWRFGKARTAHARGKADETRRWLKETLATIEAQRASLADFRWRASLLDNKYDVFDFALELALKDNDTSAAFEIAERARARTLLDSLGSKTAAAASTPICTLAQLEAVNSDVAIVTFFQRRTEVLAWVTRSGQTSLLRLALNEARMSEAVGEYYAGVQGHRKTFLEDEQNLPLIQDFWKPLIEKLPDNTRVCLIPHRILHYVPFQALKLNNVRFIENHDLYYAPSGSALLAMNNRSRSKENEFVLFDSAFSSDPTSPFHTTESAGLRANFADGKFFLEKDATLDAFRRSAPSAGILHISAHGNVNLASPGHSLIALTPGNGDDGLLQADEIYHLRFPKAPLVVLSACYSSAGGLAAGDEVTGVTRAFLTAGAENVAGSLWPVDNAATTALMKEFYSELAKTPRDAVRALCQAQRNLSKTLKHPMLWAAFGLYGRGLSN